ncbi:MAG: hypothetical protein KBF97_00840 [Bacteroidetes bacterium]|nr:hypothetical protein [Bacteroidota bacterium]
MDYALDLSFNGTYLHAVVTGANTLQAMDRYFTDIRNALEQQRCKSVLIEKKLEGPGLDTFDVFEVIRSHARYARDHGLRIAYVDLNRDQYRTTVAFGENLANILGVNAKVFSDADSAALWLTGISG